MLDDAGLEGVSTFQFSCINADSFYLYLSMINSLIYLYISKKRSGHEETDIRMILMQQMEPPLLLQRTKNYSENTTSHPSALLQSRDGVFEAVRGISH